MSVPGDVQIRTQILQGQYEESATIPLSVLGGSAYTPRMRLLRVRMLAALLCAVMLGASLAGRAEPDWSRFRGPNGSGISTATNVPTEFGPATNLLWRLPLPPGHSSPILLGDRIYLTAYRGGRARHPRHRSPDGRRSLGARGAGGQDEDRRQAKQPRIAEPRRRRQRRLRVLSRLRPHRLRRGRQAAVVDAARARSTTSTAWAPRR